MALIPSYPAGHPSTDLYAVLSSVAKIVAAGGDHKDTIYFSRIFPPSGDDPKRWGEPLVAFRADAQIKLGLPS